MKKLFKFIGWCVTLFLVFLIIALVAFKIWFNPNRFKQTISDLVYNKTGQHLALKGDVDVTFFPKLGLMLEDVALSNPKAFSQEKPMVKLDKLQFGIAVLPLLKGELKTQALVLKGLHVYLIRQPSGETNWQHLQDSKPIKAVPVSTADTTALAAVSAPMVFSVPAINISHAQLALTDQEVKQTIILSDINVAINKFQLGQAFPVTFSAKVHRNYPGLKGAIKGAGKITIDKAFQYYRVQDFTVSTNLLGRGLPGDALALQADGDFAYSVKDNKMTLSQFSLDYPPLTLKNALLNVKVTPPLKRAVGQYATLRNLNADVSLTVPTLQYQKMHLHNVQGAFDASKGRLRLSRLTGHIAEGQANIAAVYDVTGKVPKIHIQQTLKNVDAHQLLSFFDMTVPVSGTANLTSHLSTQGGTSADWQQHLEGSLQFSVKQGMIEGMNFAQWLTLSIDDLTKGRLPQGMGDRNTAFSDFSGTVTLNHGIAKTDDTQLIANIFRVKVKATANIPTQRLSGDIMIYPGKGKGVITIPLMLSGTFSDPSIVPDLKTLLGSQLKNQAENITSVIGTQVGKHLNKDTGKKIQGLLNQFFQ